jgi:nicotinate-nucleotide--dimethylbenzimidazole phosphoribosyltransferase
MAADHGVVSEGVSAYPQEVTAQMVYNFLRGGAAINVLVKHIAAHIVVVDIGVATKLEPHPSLLSKKVNLGTRNMANCPAMTAEEAMEAIQSGIDILEGEIAKGLDIVGIGDMGIGNTTPSAAITAVITGQPVGQVTGRGTGINDDQLAHKIKVIERAIKNNKPNPQDPLDVLAKVGGFEIGGLVGVILRAAAHRIPIVLDGFITGAAALIAQKFHPLIREFLIASHRSAEWGHRAILDYLGLKPLLDLDLRLGEGTGATLGIFLAEAGVKILREMATFAEARVSERKE